MSRHMIIYIHGFNSSPASIKACLLGDYLASYHADISYQVPTLSHWPNEAMQTLIALIQAHSEYIITLVGSSLGGFYSINLVERYPQCRAVLINPAIYPYRLLENGLGENENLYTHERYTLTREHLSQLQSLAVPHFSHSKRCLLLTQTADATLDYQEGVAYLKESIQFVQPGGSHGFDQFEKVIPAIVDFAYGTVALPLATVLPVSE